MPRLKTRILLEARRIDSLLPLLLRECRSLESARSEWRWLRERALHIVELKRPRYRKNGTQCGASSWRSIMKSMCLARSRGVPLQYILGDQPFGDLDIKCRKGVLIPRHETEAITLHAANLILDRMAPKGRRGTPLKILDLCTGTGCIPLLLHALLAPCYSKLSIVGVDISDTAVQLAKENIARNVGLGLLSERALKEVSFQKGNVLDYGLGQGPASDEPLVSPPNASTSSRPRCDVLMSNPPYVSLREYCDGTTSRSVRVFEPRLALVPPDSCRSPILNNKHVRHEDMFYYHLASVISNFDVKLALLECGSYTQGLRVAALCRDILRLHGRVDKVLVDIWSASEFSIGPCAVIIHIEG